MRIDIDYFPPVDLSDYLRPLPMPPGGYPDGKCQRCELRRRLKPDYFACCGDPVR